MKFFASVIIALSVSPALAAVPDWIIPSPIAITIHVGKWIFAERENNEIFLIRVQSKGVTETEARNEAFRLAVEKAVGSLLVSETIVVNDRFNHELINYSSGYIHDFEYIHIHRGEAGVTLHLDVWVKKSAIAERITLQNQSEGRIDGHRIAESLRSLNTQFSAGDSLLLVILNDFPERALTIQVENIEFIVEQRIPFVTVVFNVVWRSEYLESLSEVLKAAGLERRTSRNGNGPGITLRGVRRCDGYFCDDRHYAMDQARQNLIINGFDSKQVHVLVTILNASSDVLFQACARWANLLGTDYGRDQIRKGNVIYTEAHVQNSFKLDVSDKNIDKMDRVEVIAIREDRCPHRTER